MFTGLITDLGEVRSLSGSPDRRLVIATHFDLDTIALGASVACNGCCLTVVDKGEGTFAVDVSLETLSKTTIGRWRVGTPVNLERSLRLGDELGGHLVYGHVDGLAEVTRIEKDAQSQRITLRAPAPLARYIAAKGSVALDGVSLTVNEVDGADFAVNIIPHTAAVTSLGQWQAGDLVNLEIDMLARYLARLLVHGDG